MWQMNVTMMVKFNGGMCVKGRRREDARTKRGCENETGRNGVCGRDALCGSGQNRQRGKILAG